MRIDIFCKVVDNYGDAGFCWRLTRRLTEILHQEYFTTSTNSAGNTVRLFCDDLALIAKLAGSTTLLQLKNMGLELHNWSMAEQLSLEDTSPNVVLETFSCELPQYYLEQITDSLLINVEYLSAEPWIEEMHGLASLPSNPKQPKRYFYYPGFNEQTGGLLGKALQPPVNEAVKKRIDEFFSLTRKHTQVMSIFNYGDERFQHFLDNLTTQLNRVDCLICYGKPQEAVSNWLGEPFLTPIDRGAVRLIPVPFVTQEEYDELLARCDLNWVRGEDSFVRAQWAAKPFIWDIYPQADQVHEKKLDAFLAIYLPKEDPNLSQLFKNMMRNQPVDIAWQQLKPMQEYAQYWQNYLANQQLHSDLGERIIQFIKTLVK